jgi:hypothetical protein
LEDRILRRSIRRSPAAAIIIVCSLLVVATGSSRATTLPRLAASLDFSRLAASGPSAMVDEMSLVMPVRTVLPPSVELLGPTTEVRIGLAHESDVDIEVTDESGALVCNASVHMPAGWQKVAFSGRGHDGQPLPNGVYFYRVAAGDEVMVTRVVISR